MRMVKDCVFVTTLLRALYGWALTVNLQFLKLQSVVRLNTDDSQNIYNVFSEQHLSSRHASAQITTR